MCSIAFIHSAFIEALIMLVPPPETSFLATVVIALTIIVGATAGFVLVTRFRPDRHD